MAAARLLLATALLVALVSASEATKASSRIGPGWEPIKYLKDRKIVAIAKFAVKSYNEAYPTHEPLKLVSVDKGEVLADVGTNYHLYITASTRIGNDKYQAFVFEIPSGKWSLISFVKLIE